MSSNRVYKVGQVVYVLSTKETKIYPVQVIEEIIKRTVAGETVSYLARVGKGQKLIPLAEIDGDLFEEVDLLREVLTQRVMSTVNKAIDNAIVKAGEWYDQPTIHSPIIENPKEDDSVVVQLPDGKFANLKMPNLT